MSRLERLRGRLDEEGLDALIVARAVNIRYLTGFSGVFDSGFAGYLAVSAETATLITDFRYEQQLTACAADSPILIESTSGEYVEALATIVAGPGLARTAIEDTVSVTTKKSVDKACGRSLATAAGIVESLRVCKEEPEIAAIARAAAAADDAFKHAVELVRVGASTRTIALEIEWHMRTHGATATAFELIVAAGKRSSMPHAVTQEQTIEAGDFVTIDIGAVVDDYCSDMTRTVIAGEASAEHRRIYEAVLDAQRSALGGLRPGMSGREADAVARGSLTERGFGDEFGHGLGHGVGLEVHERPRLARTSDDVLRTGMVVTIEPGVYVPGFGGVRIEDLVVVEDEGARNFTATPKELLVV